MDDASSGTPDRIRLTGITATGYHGVFDHERRDGQRFIADVVLHVDTRAAAAADRLDLTADYGRIVEQVADVIATDPVDLIETVAERIAAVALADGAVHAVDVVVHKPDAPVTVPVADIAVQIHRDRSHAPVADRPAAAPATTGGPDTDPGASLGTLVAPALAVPTLEDAPVDAGPDPAPLPVPDREPDRLDDVPDEAVHVVLALGSNQGSSQEILRQAVQDLDAVRGLEITEVGPLARTAPVGPADQPDFLNTVLLARTTLSPRALLHACMAVEQQHGRDRGEVWGPRTLDIDVIMHGSTVAVADDLELPHPRANQRAFVLQPWAHLEPDAVLPGLGGGPVAVLAETAPDREGIRWMALDWWGGEARS